MVVVVTVIEVVVGGSSEGRNGLLVEESRE